jgi:hypothetical protein
MVFVFFLLRVPDRSSTEGTLKHKLQQLNIEGLLALLPGVICLCLALQWGGFTYNVSFGPEVPSTAPSRLPRTSRANRFSGATGASSLY